MFEPYHTHPVVYAAVRRPITDSSEGKQFLKNVIEVAGMTCINGPHMANVRDLGNEGLTGTATLAESHTSIHIWEKAEPTPYVQFDLYSCKKFPLGPILELFEDMEPTVIRWTLLDRNDGHCSVVETDSKVFGG